MLVEGTGELPSCLFLLGALATFPSPSAVSVTIPFWRFIPLLSFPQPLGRRVFFAVVAIPPCFLSATTSPGGSTVTTDRGAVAAAMLLRRELLIEKLHDYDHNTVYQLLLPSLKRSLAQLLRSKVTARLLVVAVTRELTFASHQACGVIRKSNLSSGADATARLPFFVSCSTEDVYNQIGSQLHNGLTGELGYCTYILSDVSAF